MTGEAAAGKDPKSPDKELPGGPQVVGKQPRREHRRSPGLRFSTWSLVSFSGEDTLQSTSDPIWG